MNANEFLHKKNVAYMNRLSTSLDFNAVVALMEEYAALRIHDVVGRSEQLVCEYCNEDAKPTCCDKCLENMVNAVQKAN